MTNYVSRLKSRLFKTLLATFFVPGFLTAQDATWKTIGVADNSINTLISFENKMFFGGRFSEFGGQTCLWAGYWDGKEIMENQVDIPGGGFNSFIIYKDQLFGIGSFNKGLKKWNGTLWENAGDVGTSSSALYTDGDTLFIGTDFGDLRAYVDGEGLVPGKMFSFGSNTSIGAITKYKGELVVAGDIKDYNDVVVRRGGKWVPLNGGVRIKNPFKLFTFNGDLILIGDFDKSDKIPATGMLTLSDTGWTAFAGGVTGDARSGVRDAFVYGPNLYVVGDFQKMDTIECKGGVARWNGSQWFDLELNERLIDYPRAVTVSRGDIFVAVEGNQEHNIYRRSVLASVEEPEMADIELFPNPSSNSFQVNLLTGSDVLTGLRLVDMAGRTVMSFEQLDQTNQIDISALQPGLYQVVVRSNSGTVYHKTLVKN